jgi:AcrR family transcriptional regulator
MDHKSRVQLSQVTNSKARALAAKSAAERKPRRTQEERTATARAKLMEAAIALICEKGFANTTMAEIAAAADFTRGAIHHHFQNRVDLVRAIINEVERRVIESFSAAAPKPNVSLEQRIDILMGLPGKVWVDLCDFRAAAAYR